MPEQKKSMQRKTALAGGKDSMQSKTALAGNKSSMQSKTGNKSSMQRKTALAGGKEGIRPQTALPGSSASLQTESDRRVLGDFLYAAAPALGYTLLSNTVYACLTAGGLLHSAILLQAVSVSVCLLVFIWYAHREHVAVAGRKKTVYRYPAAFCYTMAVVMCGIVNNYIFALIQSKFQDVSKGYARVTEVFYHQELALEIVTLCVLAPIAEELVYRGFVYQRMRTKGSETVAAVFSALLFGALHFNLVQFFYASVLGLLLAHIVYKTGSLIAAAAAHMAANLVSVLWTETDWMDFLNQDGWKRYAAAVICLVLTGIFISYGNRLMRGNWLMHGNQLMRERD